MSGEVSQVKVGAPRPRPLGLVKSESVHFETEEGNTPVAVAHAQTPGGKGKDCVYFYGRSKTEDDIRCELKSMRDLQESLRQAALLNIVAAVNHETKTPLAMPTSRAGGSQTVGIKGASLLGHTLTSRGGGNMVFTHHSSEFPAGTFSRHLQMTCPSPLASPQNSALNQLLSQKQRTISIPRPRTHGDQGSFMHSSLLDAKEQLTNFRGRPRQEQDMDAMVRPYGVAFTDSKDQGMAHLPAGEEYPGRSTDALVSSTDFTRSAYALRGTGLDKSHPPELVPNHKAGTNEAVGQTSVRDSVNLVDTHDTAKLSKEERRAHNVYQMQLLKRHITTSKKREMVKKLTEIAKCDAVDMKEHLEGDGSEPMIILAQKKNISHLDIDSPEYPQSASMIQRASSTSSLNAKTDGALRVPSNTRVQSETLDTITRHRETKKINTLNVGEDLRIESINSIDSNTNRPTSLRQNGRVEDCGQHSSDMNVWFRESLLGDGIVGRNVQHSVSPEVLELRPLATSPGYLNRTLATDRKRNVANRRLINVSVRDKLISPSPVVYEAAYHRPKASIGQITLTGQSLPSLSVGKPSQINAKPSSRKHSQESLRSSSRAASIFNGEDNPLRLWNEHTEKIKQGLKPWGSTARQTTAASPILRTEILDHLQCVGIIDRRPAELSHRKSNSKISGIDKVGLQDDKEILDEFGDVDDQCSEVSRKKMSNYRKSKLYSAFRASEENLANLAEVSSLVSETLTARSLLNQPMAGGQPHKELPAPSQSRDPVQQSVKEPRYMGCSSRVSENEASSQFLFANGQDEADAKQGANFRVFKALDQDVYFDFQHKKYRNNNISNSTGTLNTAGNKPRMHFIKIKYTG